MAGAATAKVHPLGLRRQQSFRVDPPQRPSHKTTTNKTQEAGFDSRTAPYPCAAYVHYARTVVAVSFQTCCSAFVPFPPPFVFPPGRSTSSSLTVCRLGTHAMCSLCLHVTCCGSGFRFPFGAAVAVALGRSRDCSLTDRKNHEETMRRSWGEDGFATFRNCR